MKSRAYLLFFAALTLAMAWTGWLVYMVTVAADPVVVSAPQLHLASLVIVGDVTVQGSVAKVKIIKTFKDAGQALRQNPLPETITVNWLPAFPPSPTGSLLLALIREAGSPETYSVSSIPLPTTFLEPRIYPYTDSVRFQVESILGAKE